MRAPGVRLALAAVFASLAAPPSAGQSQAWFDGLSHTGLGQATLNVAGDELIVSNIGSSGLDGVCVELGEVDGFRWGTRHDLSLPVGATLTDTFTGTQGAATVVTSVRRTITALGLLHEPDFTTLGASTYTATVLLGESVVFTASGLVGPQVEQYKGFQRWQWYCKDGKGKWYCKPEGERDIVSTFMTPAGEVEGDQLILAPDAVVADITWNAADFRAANISVLGFRAEAIRKLGRPHLAAGDAQFETKCDCIVISNIGASGDDGVCMKLHGAESLAAEWSPVDPAGAAPVGAALDFGLLGWIANFPESDVGSIRVEKTATDLALSADFSGAAGSNVTVEVLAGGMSLGTFAASAATIARFADWPVGMSGARGLALGCAWSFAVAIEIVGHGTFVGDELRLRATTDATLGPLQTAEVRVTSVDMLELTTETEDAMRNVGSEYCSPAVANSSGFPARIDALGSAVVAADDFVLMATDLAKNQFGYFLMSETQGFVAHPGGSAGNLFLGGSIARLRSQLQNAGAAGALLIGVDLTSIPTSPPQAVVAGDTWNAQAWFRDGSTSNFTDGVSVVFQ